MIEFLDFSGSHKKIGDDFWTGFLPHGEKKTGKQHLVEVAVNMTHPWLKVFSPSH